MTKIQRRKIYEKVLWCIGDDVNPIDDTWDNNSVCILLWWAWRKRKVDINKNWCYIIDTTFPEFAKQEPYLACGFWWSFTAKGNAKRRIALEKAIQLTY